MPRIRFFCVTTEIQLHLATQPKSSSHKNDLLSKTPVIHWSVHILVFLKEDPSTIASVCSYVRNTAVVNMWNLYLQYPQCQNPQ